MMAKKAKPKGFEEGYKIGLRYGLRHGYLGALAAQLSIRRSDAGAWDSGDLFDQAEKWVNKNFKRIVEFNGNRIEQPLVSRGRLRQLPQRHTT
jgi:hypothetical protein